MDKEKKLRTKKNFVVETSRRMALCNIEIYEKEHQEIEIIIGDPEEIKYYGISSTNYFEHFATAIKKHYFPNLSTKKIKWLNRFVFPTFNNETFIKNVRMDFDGKTYSNPDWYWEENAQQ
jgi:hypothetical protein